MRLDSYDDIFSSVNRPPFLPEISPARRLLRSPPDARRMLVEFDRIRHIQTREIVEQHLHEEPQEIKIVQFKHKITPFLGFNTEAEDAAKLEEAYKG